ncbi:hypothetical protein SAMN05216480_12339 [Pustulibacterium marinum]|uniref:Uncharacterized protein n=1 Tax=Pustulibacterium marinum TaxID=1224947 RepID=A0A1I7IWM5_9FLAO|nr:hypothetical protein [Pustulibacterium marinum]SFU77292.1 hypothetical protein SAMN05216480_12339 [Pustulibacterium marinum]
MNNLKSLPTTITKQWMYKHYGLCMSEKFIRTEINTIIIAKRGLQQTKAPAVRIIHPLELKEFIEIHGTPPGFQNPYKEHSQH